MLSDLNVRWGVTKWGNFWQRSDQPAAGNGRRIGARKICRHSAPPLIDALELRILFSAIVVTSTADSGAGSLRAAIAVANSSGAATTITFDPSVFSTPETITLGGTALELTNTAQQTTITGPATGLTINGNNQSIVFVIDANVTASFSEITVTGGFSGTTSGAGISNNGSLALTNCTVIENNYLPTDFSDTRYGGGGIANSGTLALNSSTISDNKAVSDYDGGGGILNTGAATVTDCTIDGNGDGNSGEDQDGGGIYNGGTIRIVDSAITNNETNNDGGGMTNEDGTATLINTTVANNDSNGGVGAIENQAGTLNLYDDTISGNSGGFGGILSDSATLTLANSIIAQNVGTESAYPNDSDIYGTATSLGNNLIGAPGDATGFISTDLIGTNDVPLNANLGPLANNGGPTQTMLPGNGPAIGNGSVALIPAGIVSDQRGLPRMSSGIVDIGAVELQRSGGLAIANLVSDPTVITGFSDMYTVTVTNTAGTQATGVQVADALPLGLAFISATPSAGTYDSTSGVWTIGTLGASGAQATLTISVNATPSSGTVTSTAVVTSTSSNPNSAFDTASASLEVVPAPPTVMNDSYSVEEETPLEVDAAMGVLANDTGTGILQVASFTQPAHGTVDVNTAGSFTYSPASGFYGATSFTYEASIAPDGAPSTDATVTINVIPFTTYASTTTLTTSDSAIGQGDNVTLTATVISAVAGTAAPTGEVQFTASPGGTLLGIAAVQPDGTATLTTATVPVGTNYVTATYNGDSTYLGSDMVSVLTVAAYPTPVPVGAAPHTPRSFAPFTLANGTTVSVTITGGLATVASVGDDVRLTLTGSPTVHIRTHGGTNVLTLASVSDTGRLHGFIAPTADLTGPFDVSNAGHTIGNINLGSISGTLFVAGGIANMTVVNVTGTVACSGALGLARFGTVSGKVAAARIGHMTADSLQDAQVLAGVILNSIAPSPSSDAYVAGDIISLRVNGAVGNSLIAAGAAPGVDGILGTSDDEYSPGATDRIEAITIKGQVDSSTRFESVVFPKIVHIPAKVNPAVDARFTKLTLSAT